MAARVVVLYDANVLYPAQLRDLFMRLAVAGLVRAHFYEALPEHVVEVMRRHRTSLRRPPKTPTDYLATLERAGLARTGATLRKHLDAL